MARACLSSLRVRLLLLVLLAVVPALGLLLYTAWEERRWHTRKVQEDAIRLTKLVASNYEGIIEGTRQVLVSLAELREVRQRDAMACSALFASLRTRYTRYASFDAVDSRGKSFCSAFPSVRALNAADRPWFQRAVQTRAFAVGEYQISRASGKATINFGYPVLDSAGKVQGVVLAALDLAHLNALAAEAQLPKGAVLIVVDSKGTILARHPDPEKWVGQSMPDTPIINTMLTQREGVVEAPGVDGIPRLFAFTPLQREAQAVYGYVGVGIATSVAFAEVNRVLVVDFALLGLVAVLAMAAAWMGGNTFILHPVKRLVSAAGRLASGDLTARTGGPYGPGELDEVTRAFDQMAESMERRETDRKRAEATLVEQTRQLETVRRISEEITRELNLTTLLDLIVRRAAELVGATNGTVCLWDEELQAIVPQAWRGLGEWVRQVRYRLGESVTGTVAQRRHGMIVNDYRTSPYCHPLFAERTQTAAVLSEPLLYHDRLVGTITLGSDGGRPPFTEQDREVLALFAAQASVAIENARLYEESKRRQNAAEALAEVGRLLSQSLDPEEVAQRIVDNVRRLLDVHAATLFRLEPESGDLVTTAISSDVQPALVKNEVLPQDSATVGLAVRERKSVTTSDFLTDPLITLTPELRARLEQLPYRAVFAVPLVVQERVIGALSVGYPAGRVFGQEETRLVEAFADQAAIALENAHLYAERKQTEAALVRRTRQLEAVRAVTAEIARELDLPAVLSLIIRRAVELAGARSGAVYLWDETAQVLVPQVWHGPKDWIKEIRLRLGQGVSGTVAQRRAGMIVNDYRASPYAQPLFLDQSEVTAVLAEPLLYRDQLLGVITIDNEESGRAFSGEDREVMALFATHAAIALENARLFEQVRAGRKRLQVLSRKLVEVQELERRHIARELHDEIGQVLTGLKLTLEMSSRLPADATRTSLGEAQTLVNDLIAQVRELSLDLRPAILDDLGLLPALLAHFERYTAKTCVRVAYEHAGLGRRFPSEVETAAYRIVQEALTNIARHAGVGEASVRLWAGEEKLGVQIEDGGAGFDPDAVLSAVTSSGLVGMRERAVLVGGHLEIESAPWGGTRVTAELPLGRRFEKRKKER